MSAQSPAWRSGIALGPDSPISRVLLTVLQHAESSMLALVCLMPAFAFHALVGWQATHVAIWLGVASLLPVGPAVFALLSQSRDFLVAGAYPGRGVRRFAAALSRGAVELRTWWALSGLIGLLLAYNLALFGASDAILVGAIGLVAVLLLGTIGLSSAVLAGHDGGLLQLLAQVARAVALRPHVAMSWLLLSLVCCLATLLPVIGSGTALFLPGLAAAGMLVVNSAMGFDAAIERSPEAR